MAFTDTSNLGTNLVQAANPFAGYELARMTSMWSSRSARLSHIGR